MGRVHVPIEDLGAVSGSPRNARCAKCRALHAPTRLPLPPAAAFPTATTGFRYWGRVTRHSSSRARPSASQRNGAERIAAEPSLRGDAAASPPTGEAASRSGVNASASSSRGLAGTDRSRWRSRDARFGPATPRTPSPRWSPHRATAARVLPLTTLPGSAWPLAEDGRAPPPSPARLAAMEAQRALEQAQWRGTQPRMPSRGQVSAHGSAVSLLRRCVTSAEARTPRSASLTPPPLAVRGLPVPGGRHWRGSWPQWRASLVGPRSEEGTRCPP